MDPVQPVTSSNMGTVSPVQIQPNSASPGAGAAGGAVSQVGTMGTLSSSTTSITATATSASAVYSRVDAMLSAVGIDLQNNEVLRMIIALMILQALLAQDGGSQQAGGAQLLGGDGGRAHAIAGFLSVQSETNIVQIQQQSLTVSTSQAIQTIGLSSGQDDAGGAQFDTHV